MAVTVGFAGHNLYVYIYMFILCIIKGLRWLDFARLVPSNINGANILFNTRQITVEWSCLRTQDYVDSDSIFPPTHIFITRQSPNWIPTPFLGLHPNKLEIYTVLA